MKNWVASRTVTEVLLEDNRSSFFVGSPGTGTAAVDFVEVFGALPPSQGSHVEIVRFQRYDRFHQIICENDELRACRESLEQCSPIPAGNRRNEP